MRLRKFRVRAYRCIHDSGEITVGDSSIIGAGSVVVKNVPKNTIVDGSVALLTLKNGSRLPTEQDLEFYSTKEFENYYRVARNHGTRSLNIDNNSVFFFGLLKELSE